MALFNEGLEPGRTYPVLVKTLSGNVASWPATANVTTRKLRLLIDRWSTIIIEYRLLLPRSSDGSKLDRFTAIPRNRGCNISFGFSSSLVAWCTFSARCISCGLSRGSRSGRKPSFCRRCDFIKCCRYEWRFSNICYSAGHDVPFTWSKLFPFCHCLNGRNGKRICRCLPGHA